MYKYKPSKEAAAAYAEQIKTLRAFCAENNISSSRSGESYYFALNGKKYRISNHTIDSSDAGAYDRNGEQIRGLYHYDADLICYTASRLRVIEIYTALQAGKKLNARGKEVQK